MKVDVPIGDVADRITILRIKVRRIDDPHRRGHARRELQALARAWDAAGLTTLEALGPLPRLAEVNEALWEVEDALRAHEARRDFGEAFVSLARSVYRLNDERAALKAEINRALGSELVEVKSYSSDNPAGTGTDAPEAAVPTRSASRPNRS